MVGGGVCVIRYFVVIRQSIRYFVYEIYFRKKSEYVPNLRQERGSESRDGDFRRADCGDPSENFREGRIFGDSNRFWKKKRKIIET